MDKLKSITSRLTFSNMRSSPSAKLSKAFKFNKEHNVMSRSETRDPFKDGPTFEEPSLSKLHIILHTVAGFFCFLAICTIAAVAAFQAKWTGVSGATGFVLFLTLVSFILTTLLVVIPIIYDRWDRLKRPAQFLAVARSTVILHAFGTGIMLLSAFIVTISAWTAKGCKNPDDDPHAHLGDEFKTGLEQWCTTKKASAIFDWFSFAAWSVLLVFAVLAFRRERRREPVFVPPSDGISYANVHQHVPSARDDDPYADKHESLAAPAGSATGYESYGYGGVRGGDEEAFGRPSMDAYGAFDNSAARHNQRVPVSVAPVATSGNDESSRTMQMAYTDPYAHIRQSLMSGSDTGYSQGGYQQGYSQMPHPPAYGSGYR